MKQNDKHLMEFCELFQAVSFKDLSFMNLRFILGPTTLADMGYSKFCFLLVAFCFHIAVLICIHPHIITT